MDGAENKPMIRIHLDQQVTIDAVSGHEEVEDATVITEITGFDVEDDLYVLRGALSFSGFLRMEDASDTGNELPDAFDDRDVFASDEEMPEATVMPFHHSLPFVLQVPVAVQLAHQRESGVLNVNPKIGQWNVHVLGEQTVHLRAELVIQGLSGQEGYVFRCGSQEEGVVASKLDQLLDQEESRSFMPPTPQLEEEVFEPPFELAWQGEEGANDAGMRQAFEGVESAEVPEDDWLIESQVVETDEEEQREEDEETEIVFTPDPAIVFPLPAPDTDWARQLEAADRAFSGHAPHVTPFAGAREFSRAYDSQHDLIAEQGLATVEQPPQPVAHQPEARRDDTAEHYATDFDALEGFAVQDYANESDANEGFVLEQFANESLARDGFAAERYVNDFVEKEGFAEEHFAKETFAKEAFAALHRHADDSDSKQGFTPEPVAHQEHARERFASDPIANEEYAPDRFAKEDFAPERFAVEAFESEGGAQGSFGQEQFMRYVSTPAAHVKTNADPQPLNDEPERAEFAAEPIFHEHETTAPTTTAPQIETEYHFEDELPEEDVIPAAAPPVEMVEQPFAKPAGPKLSVGAKGVTMQTDEPIKLSALLGDSRAQAVEALAESACVESGSLTESAQLIRESLTYAESNTHFADADDEIQEFIEPAAPVLTSKQGYTSNSFWGDLLFANRETKTTMKFRIVQEDESLPDLAEKYNTPLGELLRVNNLQHNHVDAGQILYIPQRRR